MEGSESRLRSSLVATLAIALAVMMPGALAAQMAKSPPPAGANTHSMAPGERYGKGGFGKWLFGSDYRSLWTTPIEAPVLDLDSVGGGLTPIRTGGFGQSVSLHFQGNDGRRYVVRSMDKDPTKRLLPQLKGTLAEDIVQDQISALHPTAALVVDPLLEATGILHARHTLVIIPDDPRLGEFREEFAGLMGMLLLHPDEGADNTPGFAGSRRISGSEQFLERLEAGPCDRVNARAFLKARLMDLLIGDKDRHAGQWRWASYPRGECREWLPIPEDRDQAFIDFDGFVMFATRRTRPQQIKFGEDYPSITGLTFNAWEVDRELLVELDKPVWDSVVGVIQRELTDDVIDEAVRRMPAPHYEMSGERITRALESRRDKLGEAADEYYRMISRWPEILATDDHEYAILEHRANGDLNVRIGERHRSDGTREDPYIDRTFRADVTKEVRIYMRGGDDEIEVCGAAGRIVVRVDGGGGDDRFENMSQSGAGKTAFYDSRGDNTFDRGQGARVDERRYERPPAKDQAHKNALDWGGRAVTLPLFGYGPDPGLYIGWIGSFDRYGYRKDPFKVRHSLGLGLVTNGPEPIVGYRGTVRSVWPRVDARIDLVYSGISFLRFNGFGNETQIPGSTAFYKLEQRELLVAPSLVINAGPNRAGLGAGSETLRETFTIQVGPVLKYSNTDLDDNAAQFIGGVDPVPYGTGHFGLIGGRATLEFDSRDNSGYPKKGLHLTAEGAVYPRVWDVVSTFGEVHGAISTYLTAPIPTEPTLALRAGGQKVWGTFPFREAAYIGGARSLRGYRSQRFAGDASAYGNAELRIAIGRIKILVPGQFGFFGLADAGRVFFDDDPADADTWHTAFGGGLWLSFIDRLQTVSVAVVSGDDLTGLYVQAGMPF